jgi:hypothetical protein
MERSIGHTTWGLLWWSIPPAANGYRGSHGIRRWSVL